MAKELRRGAIILAKLNDRKKKISEHFAVVLTKSVDIHAGADLAVAGISTGFSYPLPPHWHAIETHPEGKCASGLREACVVKSDWRDVVKQKDIIAVRGYALTRIVKQIIKYWEQNP